MSEEELVKERSKKIVLGREKQLKRERDRER